jgi:hypothetical protein
MRGRERDVTELGSIVTRTIEHFNATIKRLEIEFEAVGAELAAARSKRSAFLLKNPPWAVGDVLQTDDGIYRVEGFAPCFEGATAQCKKRRPDGSWSKTSSHGVSFDRSNITVVKNEP